MEKTFTLAQLLTPGVIDHLIETSVWKASPVTETPDIELERWQVLRRGNGDQHFVGWNMTEVEGRVSSRIVEFDARTQCGRTSSGRVYRLRGRTGHDADAAYVWRRWAAVNGAEDAVDISESVQALIDAAAAQGSAP